MEIRAQALVERARQPRGSTESKWDNIPFHRPAWRPAEEGEDFGLGLEPAPNRSIIKRTRGFQLVAGARRPGRLLPAIPVNQTHCPRPSWTEEV